VIQPERRPVLYAIVCAAGPARHVHRLIQPAQERGWDVWVIPTPAAVDFLDVLAVEELSGHPARSRHRQLGEPGTFPRADAIIVAPATYNTINKWAHGTSDNYALGLLAELVPLGVPTAVLPFLNAALAANPVLARSIAELQLMGVRVLVGRGEFEPHQPGTGVEKIDSYPWHLVLDAVGDPRRRRIG
jgi:phosphopantothenoylcysteine synthetase/decarboxylase